MGSISQFRETLVTVSHGNGRGETKTAINFSRFANTTWYRNFATSASIQGGLLLVGGYAAPWTSELISGQGGSSEAFVPSPGRSYHCSIQVSNIRHLLDPVREYSV